MPEIATWGTEQGWGCRLFCIQKALESHSPCWSVLLRDRHRDSGCGKSSPHIFKSLPRAYSASAGLHNGARMALSDCLGVLLDSRVSVSWDQSWSTRSVVKVRPTHLRGWIHVVPSLLPVAIFFLRTWCQSFSASYFLQMIAVS